MADGTALQTNAATNEVLNFDDPISASAPFRFFRAVVTERRGPGFRGG